MSFWSSINSAGPWIMTAAIGAASLWNTAKNNREANRLKAAADGPHSVNETATTHLAIQDQYQKLIEKYYEKVGELSAKVLLLEGRVGELERKLAIADAENLVLRKRDENCADVERENILLKSQNKDLEEQLSLLKIEIAAASMGQAAAEAGLKVAQKMLGGINPALVGDMQHQIDEVRAQMRENVKRIERQEHVLSPPPFG